MKHQPEIAVQPDGDALADASQFADDTAFYALKRRLCGSKQKGARQSNPQEWMANNARLKRTDISGYVREFGYTYQLACRSMSLQAHDLEFDQVEILDNSLSNPTPWLNVFPIGTIVLE
jgi:hypothetical protein